MNAPPIDLRALSTAGFEALRRGDLACARDAFTRASASGNADANIWYGLSLVHRRMGAAADEDTALDQALRAEAHHVPALIGKGDLHARGGAVRAANSYYSAALSLAASQPNLPPQWRPELRRIEEICQRFAREYEAHLRTAIARTGVSGAGTERFGHALDLLLGKRQIYFQQPKHFFFPELPQVQFYERRLFPWVQALEGSTSLIRAELEAILTAGSPFVPYIQREANRPSFDPRGLLENPDWSACYLIKSGVEVADNVARCPNTMRALSELPLCRIVGRTPSVLFSLLRPGAHIPPHHGFMNTRLICHLPLIVPANCGLRVGNETRGPREGEVMIFDDSIEHEAWNRSSALRVVLIFDVWRPELSEDERVLVAAMLESIDRFGPRHEWAD